MPVTSGIDPNKQFIVSTFCGPYQFTPKSMIDNYLNCFLQQEFPLQFYLDILTQHADLTVERLLYNHFYNPTTLNIALDPDQALGNCLVHDSIEDTALRQHAIRQHIDQLPVIIYTVITQCKKLTSVDDPDALSIIFTFLSSDKDFLNMARSSISTLKKTPSSISTTPTCFFSSNSKKRPRIEEDAEHNTTPPYKELPQPPLKKNYQERPRKMLRIETTPSPYSITIVKSETMQSDSMDLSC